MKYLRNIADECNQRKIYLPAAMLICITLVFMFSGGLVRPGQRIRFTLAPRTMPYPAAMLKLTGPDYPAPTYFTGKCTKGDAIIDLRRGGRSRMRGEITLNHMERNDPALLPHMIGHDWISKGKPVLTLRIERIIKTERTRGGGDPEGTITLAGRLTSLRGEPEITFTGHYRLEENGMSLRTGGEIQGDILTIDAKGVIEAESLRNGRETSTADKQPVTVTLWCP